MKLCSAHTCDEIRASTSKGKVHPWLKNQSRTRHLLYSPPSSVNGQSRSQIFFSAATACAASMLRAYDSAQQKWFCSRQSHDASRAGSRVSANFLPPIHQHIMDAQTKLLNGVTPPHRKCCYNYCSSIGLAYDVFLWINESHQMSTYFVWHCEKQLNPENIIKTNPR